MTFVQYLKKRFVILPKIIAGGIIMTFFVCETCNTSLSRFAIVSSLTVSCWALMWFGNEYLHGYLDEKIPWTKYPLKRLVVGVIVLTLYSVVTIYLVLIFVQKVFGLNIGAISSTIYMSMGITVVISLILTSRSFLFNWRQTAIDAEKFKKESAAAKFESLRSQVNPHFLFNSLNVLTNLVYEDPDKAVKFIKQMSDVYRYLLETKDKEIVSLEEEKKFLHAYLFLQQIRFGDKLKLTLSLNNEKGMIPPLVLQMLVENAIKHNIIADDKPLHISIYRDSEYLVVENTLQKKNILIEDSTGIGLDNICKRYEFLTDKKVEVTENEKFIVRLPLIQQVS
jgi:LytS/YehU family sensor histidine kinase